MSMAIQYQMKKRMAKGGMCEHGSTMCEMCHGGMYAKGGDVKNEEEKRHYVKDKNKKIHRFGPDENAALKFHEEHNKKYGPFSSDYGNSQDQFEKVNKIKDPERYAEGGEVEDDDMISRIMKKRAGHYSEGGRVANEDHIEADFKENEFDDLPLDDHLEEHYTGANSGDELGNEQEDEDERDVVARIMRSRGKKDRMPRPA